MVLERGKKGGEEGGGGGEALSGGLRQEREGFG